MKGFAVRLHSIVGGKEYHRVRCYSKHSWPWYQCVKYFPKKATDAEVSALLAQFLEEIPNEQRH